MRHQLASMYGYGEGEELLGRALAKRPDHPMLVSTKVGWLDRGIVRHKGDFAYRDEDSLVRAIKHSLWLLRRDFVEVMYIHEPNHTYWWGDGLPNRICTSTRRHQNAQSARGDRSDWRGRLGLR